MKINNFDDIIDSKNFDIVHREKTDSVAKIVQSSELILKTNTKETRLKFELADGNEIDKDDFIYVADTDFLFYRGMIEWCVFDLNINEIVRHESATELPFIERKNDVIIIFDDLYAESIDLRGNRIDYVMIDQPYESKEYKDRIEFDTCSFGKQTLSLIKTAHNNV